MSEIKGVWGRLASIRKRYADSGEDLNVNLNATREADRVTAEAHQLIGRAGELLIQASVLQATGVRAVQSGHGRIMGLTLDVENVYQGSNRCEEVTECANNYQDAYDNVMGKSQQTLTDSQQVLRTVNTLHTMLGVQGKRMFDIMNQSGHLIEESHAIESTMTSTGL